MKKSKGHLVMGRNALLELLKHSPERILRVYRQSTNSSNKSKFDKAAHNLDVLLQNNQIEVVDMSKDRLKRLANSDSHQGFVAELSERQTDGLHGFAENLSGQNEMSLIVALDGITDPHNLGAIFRVAECFSADALMWSKNRTAPITPTVSKTSCGASELLPHFIVNNLDRELQQLKELGFWILVTDMTPESQDLYNFSFPQKSVLVLGAEGKGVSRIIKKRADLSLKINMPGRISSLNVAQSAAVFLSFWRACPLDKRANFN